MKYRDHRGGYADSMETVVEIPATRQAIALHLNTNPAGVFGCGSIGPARPSAVKVKLYEGGVDVRNGWNTHIVTVDGLVVGFTDGPLKDLTFSEANELECTGPHSDAKACPKHAGDTKVQSRQTTIGDLIVPDAPLIPHTFQIALREGVVTLDRDGNLTLPKDGVLNEAAEVFFREVARLAKLDAIPPEIRAIGEQLRTQDNRITAEPIFCVQQKFRDYGVSSSHSDEYVMVNEDGDEVALDERAEAGPLTRLYYRDRWETVTTCFTKVGADAYIAANGHNLKEPRIYVESGYRNAEWIALRAFLKGLKP